MPTLTPTGDEPAPLGRNEQAVLGALRRSRAARSAYDILDEVRDAGLKAPTQVYRALEKLVKRGLAHRIESLNGFVACRHPQDQGFAAFAICTRCGAVRELADEALIAPLRHWAGAEPFAIEHVTLEVRGLCPACAGG
ncbi:MAG: transcriptional repressor [Alphaproteobacteria bacterium]|jgi:Fur family zinc uptake transcriptional regulator|nr:transcriptional repressor [Alphaproteobacteria bacterium]